MIPNRLPTLEDCQGKFFTAITAEKDGSLLAAAVNDGVLRISPDGRMEQVEPSMPEGTVVYRLEAEEGCNYACTSKGLFLLEQNRWVPTVITSACHRLRTRGGLTYAATANGLYYRLKDTWVRTEYTELEVYDVFHTPQMIFMSHSHGLTVYDRYTQSTVDYPLKAPVTCLTVLHGSLLGAGANGDLMVGDKKGNFDLISYGNISILSLAAAEGRVYACTNKGLYRLISWNAKYHLCSVKLGFPVTDLVYSSDSLHLSTYLQGIQSLPLSRAASS